MQEFWCQATHLFLSHDLKKVFLVIRAAWDQMLGLQLLNFLLHDILAKARISLSSTHSSNSSSRNKSMRASFVWNAVCTVNREYVTRVNSPMKTINHTASFAVRDLLILYSDRSMSRSGIPNLEVPARIRTKLPSSVCCALRPL